jgi:hypothetical protein
LIGIVALHVVGAGLQRQRQQRILVRLVLVDDDVASLVEHPADAAGLAQMPAVLGKDVTDLGDRSILVVGHDLHEHRRAAGTVSLVQDFLVRDTRQLAGPFHDRPLDVVGGHVLFFGFLDGRAEARVAVGIAPRRADTVISLMSLVKLFPRLSPPRLSYAWWSPTWNDRTCSTPCRPLPSSGRDPADL